MTQDVFMVYANCFVATMMPNHGLVILFLDGHGSHWKSFWITSSFLFFLASSHTSILSLANDAGVSKQIHWAIE